MSNVEKGEGNICTLYYTHYTGGFREREKGEREGEKERGEDFGFSLFVVRRL